MTPLTYNPASAHSPVFISSRSCSPQPINSFRHRSVPLRPTTPPSFSESEPIFPPLAPTSGKQSHSSKLIPKPPGEVGRPGRGGYNLRKITNWSKKDYDDVKDYVKLLVTRLDCNVPLGQQPLVNIRSIRDEAIAKFDFLAQYDNAWVVDDFVHCQLHYQKRLVRNRKRKMASSTYNAASVCSPGSISSGSCSPLPINYSHLRSVPFRPMTPPTCPESEHLFPPLALASGSPPPLSAARQLLHSWKSIPKPPGEVGRPGRGGYNLRKIINWSKEDYDDVKDYVKLLVGRLNCDVPFGQQPLVDIYSIRDEAVAKFEFLAQYDNTWVVDDLVRCRLQYQKRVAMNRKQRQIL
ncbi:hypothetical protein C8R41DRAFT_915651 [Lentinula lateritia]|uniref:Uncharacterized protein n=1 Tax=Lentinula lateritia TaxID=40482 RepID=A0ABQ8VRQ9_9AGAR|nr:hypothetical protein C8R41DRAFT_915651 [Lentinula lateritia]